ncbi:DUF2264 domain-containing protein [Schleiferilactobacillus shenzhenensis]|uniref:DUF2264 domain-containing protein n=1 Tax=Schleiferilactobacillus shenzhenensis LY-73 TaxID=1231336 RepID=U4TQU8_9LACO|nr:DUF2264 domain-containing protein [Schleiferilactobacillus shenzhenensis]ERL64288.1 hypothetical protein L248_1056 [Schleiferilactobacillus shenzhenensis LY-73]
MNDERTYWLETMQRIADPVLRSLANDTLHADLPSETTPLKPSALLEAFGRVVCGLGPWLGAPVLPAAEDSIREEYIRLYYEGLRHGMDPLSPDYMPILGDTQPLVDMAFLADGILRAGDVLTDDLEGDDLDNFLYALELTARIKPYESNWVLFSVLVEILRAKLGDPNASQEKIDRYLKEMMAWYKGDGIYGDGRDVHVDYYNSYVIHPLLVDAVTYYQDDYTRSIRDVVYQRAARYAATLERIISPEGTFPVLGRSITYRFGAFHALALAAWRHDLPEGVAPSQVRAALTAVIQKTTTATDMFDANGWLNIGFYGNQPAMGEGYINHGSVYLCTTVFLPLGLPVSDPFWADPAKDWTAKAVYGNTPVPRNEPVNY